MHERLTREIMYGNKRAQDLKHQDLQARPNAWLARRAEELDGLLDATSTD
jgi:hypothetical protein